MKLLLVLVVVYCVWTVSVLGAAVSGSGEVYDIAAAANAAREEAQRLQGQGAHTDASRWYALASERYVEAAERSTVIAVEAGNAAAFRSVGHLFVDAALALRDSEVQANIHLLETVPKPTGEDLPLGMDVMDLLSQYSDIGRRRQQSGLHRDAAFYYNEAANRLDGPEHEAERTVLRRLVAVQSEQSARGFEACFDSLDAARTSQDSAVAYRLIGEVGKAREMWKMCAKNFAACGIARVAEHSHGAAQNYLRHSEAASYFSRASLAYRSIDKTEDARATWLASAEQHALAGGFATDLGNYEEAVAAFDHAREMYTDLGLTELASALP